MVTQVVEVAQPDNHPVLESEELHRPTSNDDQPVDAMKEEDESSSQIRSFDMPSIDDDHEVDHVVVKKEKEDTSFSGDFCSLQEKSKCLETVKRTSSEKHHPGIENVVEKLKKHAAAVFQDNEAKFKEAQAQSQLLESTQQTRPVEEPRKLQNGLKKLILRSCENSFEKISTPDHPLVARPNLNIKESSKAPDASQIFLNESKISENNNNNIKSISNKEEVVSQKGEEDLKFVYAGNSSVPEVEDSKTKQDELLKLKGAKTKLSVDLSGLELLSNSIEQLEHLKPESQNGVSEVQQSPTKIKSISPQSESNNNNVDSPLGLLCALAEQRFMEEVADVGNKKSNIENSEEISQAGRLLLNLGKNSFEKDRKIPEKRKYFEQGVGYYEGLKRLKTYASRQEELAFQLKEKTKRNIDFSEINESNMQKKLRSLSPVYQNGDLSDSEIEHFDNAKDLNDSERRSSTDDSFEFNHHQYTSLQGKLEAKKFLAKKGHVDNDADFPNMDAMELDMRVRLADIQRQYREKQKELSKLTPKKEDKKIPGRPRKKSQSSRYYSASFVNFNLYLLEMKHQRKLMKFGQNVFESITKKMCKKVGRRQISKPFASFYIVFF